VAEVTSLGLVQMTRKKLGLGLLETFSEPCEVCAGRGIIVHHDPLVKHRSAQAQASGNGSSSSRRGGNRQQQPQPAQASAGAHAIPEGAKSALAQIAASTLHHEEEAEHAAEVLPLPELDLPVEKPKKQRRKKTESKAAPRTEKEILLDSVLSALPEPKAPGQGRARRRVTTAALTPTPIVTEES
jgi:ribonuclease E